MEVSILNLLGDDDKFGFMLFSKGLRELASHFKVLRDPGVIIQGGLATKKKQSVSAQSTKLLFGLG